MNRSSSSTPPVQKYRGVRKRKSGRWAATTKDGKTQIWLGTFKTAVEAAMAYDRAAVELRGESAVTNFPQPPNAGKVAVVLNPTFLPVINQE